MTVQRLFAIAFIILVAGVGWFILGASVAVRTGESDQKLAHEVEQIWGGEHNQRAPVVYIEKTRFAIDPAPPAGAPGGDASGNPPPTQTTAKLVTDRIAVPLQSSRVEVALGLDQRRKGLLWYNTYRVDFHGAYKLSHTDPDARELVVRFEFPSNDALYDGFVMRLNGTDLGLAGDLSQGITARLPLAKGEVADLEVSYRSRGLGPWSYRFEGQGVAQVHDFAMQMTTDCDGVDFPPGSIAPSTRTRAGAGWKLGWKFDNLLTGQRVGIDLPHRLNPGPTAFRIIFFAPVALLFFVSVLVVLGIRSGWALHPMHYAFLSAAFFAFHLLLAYLVDHLDINLSFLIAGAVSVLLVVTYLARVAGAGELLVRAAGAQVVFLLMFSYAFFFEGYTGLTVTVGSVLTLFVVMQATARLDWFEVFGRPTATGGGRA
jgi:hypothetical protein